MDLYLNKMNLYFKQNEYLKMNSYYKHKWIDILNEFISQLKELKFLSVEERYLKCPASSMVIFYCT